MSALGPGHDPDATLVDDLATGDELDRVWDDPVAAGASVHSLH